MSNFYLTCFLVGFSMSVLSAVFGSLHIHLPLKWHHAPVAHGKAMRGGRASAWLTPSALFAFLAWFGGTGYLLSQYSSLLFLSGLAVAFAAGCTGAVILSWFLVKVLLPLETVLHDSDYQLIGTIGRISSPIRSGGTGEIVFSQKGVRRCASARREDGTPLGKGKEVVITRVDKGIAYVATWEEWAK